MEHHPDEQAIAYLQGMEMANSLALGALFGPLAGAASMRSYYIGLTDRRLLFMTLGFWTGKPTGEAFETLLERVQRLEYKKKLITGMLTIYSGEKNTKLTLTIPYPQRNNAERFASAFADLPQTALTDEEFIVDRQFEAQQKQQGMSHTERVLVAILVTLVLAILLALFTSR
jgi:hypothetical protein